MYVINRQAVFMQTMLFLSFMTRMVLNAVKRAVYDESYRYTVSQCTNPYGDGKSFQRIANILASIQIDALLLTKDITF